mmetsp:Transcript_13193/g.23874  ORF Transcript_13193/g.23874 Transcript_13193/m.23874 type:complete len:146 (-) Transcript_13193:1018-1455(-)
MPCICKTKQKENHRSWLLPSVFWKIARRDSSIINSTRSKSGRYSIFYDTNGEHFLDLQDFHSYLPDLLDTHMPNEYGPLWWVYTMNLFSKVNKNRTTLKSLLRVSTDPVDPTICAGNGTMDTVHQLWKPPTSQLPWLCAMRNFMH